MKKTGKVLALLLAGALTVGLTACGKSDSSSGASGGSSSGEKVTITFQNISPDPTTPAYKIIRQLVAEYQKEHPNVEIALDTLNTDQQKLKLKTQAASREIPDITMVNPAAQMKPYVDAGLLAPLDDVLDKDGLRDTYQKGLLDYYSKDNKVYALPDGNNIEVGFYNKALFAKAGIDAPPTTFDELLADVGKLKAAGITPIAIGEKDSWTGSFLFMNILLRTNGGPGFLQDVVDGKKTFNDPAFIEAVEAFQKLVQAGAFPDGATAIDATAGGNMFRTGQAAMFFIGTWETGSNDASTVGKDIGVFKFPTVNGKGNLDEYMLAPGSAYAVSANSEHLAETKDFLHFFTSNYPKASFDMKNAVGLGQKVDGDFKTAGYSSLAIEILDMFKNIKGGDLSFDNTMNPAVSQVHLSSIQNLFVQQVDPKQVAEEHQAAFEANK
ncbi:extracellular solute-binding protein [Paenibacillus hunanensis]|uniref:Raffinose/stachyose/melibiose transport system substrate-binding protein n=1 Tax=Paenibacillus hunanensis TaxID=539262 RepID=A0ABU1J057_9BACL|nr:extracellular solute-binding protein [Paenibacillus hunanensis]MDR6243987.1 raffinose/stachyose/melibiose transport system substrate-binding protein [Paenibacillus hunanensis]GGJ15481.1 sugar-binding protein [Paenibacillus hunanensis]